MTFTYALTASGFGDNVAFVRFHTFDTVETDAVLSDEEITGLIVENSTKQRAVIAALEYRLLQLNNPMFRADWLTVDPKEAVMALERIIGQKRREFGLSKFTAAFTHVYRGDGRQDVEPDYAADK